MKIWVKAEIETLEISATTNGKLTHKYEGIDGVDAHGSDNSLINKNGTGTFVQGNTNSLS
jgi:hypothetical protein